MSTAAKCALAPAPLRVLLVGNQEEDYYLIRELLGQHRDALFAELDHVHSLDEARTRLLEKSYGLILFAHETCDTGAVRLLADFLHSGTALPFILLTEDADERALAQIVSAGPGACIEKAQLSGANLVRTARLALNLHATQQKRQSAEERVRKLSHAVEQSADTVVVTNRDGIIEYVNPAFETISGFSREQAVGKTPRILKSGEQEPEFYRDLWRTILAGKVFRSIIVNRRKSGELYYVEESISPVRDAAGNITHFIANGRDLTERYRLEAQLQQAQKMDAIGRLAGGIAHDFNNLLTIITSYSELDTAVPGSPLESKLHEILSAAHRAAQLTRQLLGFSRKQTQALRTLDLNPVVTEISQTLHRLIGEDITLTFSPGSGQGRVRVDPLQIEQILMNLAVNARDAMPEGGQLRIDTAPACLDAAYIRSKQATIPPGQYVVLSVSDSGAGIPPEHLPHIFEPFYTTKPSGKGTGLGLATVYGIVKQNRGFIWPYSEVGIGTVFKIYLPCVTEDTHSAAPASLPEAQAAGGSETILLVEDEESVRKATAEFLTLRGYTVLQARDGLDALSAARNHAPEIDLIVTDVVMPNLGGGRLAMEIRAEQPQTRFLFVSGYAGQALSEQTGLDVGENFLQKPFTLNQLARKIRELLASRVAASS